MTGPRVCSVCGEKSVARRLCRAHYQAAWKAGDLASAPLEPRKPDRKVCPADHKHAGSTTCYIQHQCRCDGCMDHHAAVARRRLKDKAYGRFDTGLIDAEPAREHLLLLGEYGIGYKRVAALAGVGITPVRNVIWGRQDPGPRKGELPKRIKAETAAAILSVKPEIEHLADGARVPARGVHRRMQALVARGWSVSRLGDLLGVQSGNALMHRDHVTVRLHRAVADLFERLWDQEPPHDLWHDKGAYSRALNYAKARRWLPPLAWDDIDTDVEPPAPDDEGGIDEMAVELATMGERVRLTPEERREVVRRLNAAHLSDQDIAARTHMADRTVLRIRQELGITAAVGADRQVIA